MKKFISLLLAVVLCLSLCTGAFAEDEEVQYRHYENAFFTGDSNSMGYGLPGYHGNDGTKNYLRGVDGSFPRLVSEGVGAAVTTNMAYPAFRAKDALRWLGGEPGSFTEKDQGLADRHFTDMYTEDSEIVDFQARLADADLVVIELGFGDTLFATLEESVFSSDSSNMVADMIEELYTNYDEFSVDYPRLLQRIRDVNSDCNIVIVGVWNPVMDAVIDDDSVIPFFNAFGIVTTLMNRNYKQWAKDYGAVYVDVSNANTFTIEEDISVTQTTLFGGEINPEQLYHLSPDGQKYVARQILNQLAVEEKPVTTDITIDLVSAESIVSVLVDGSSVKDYSYDKATATLTIPHENKRAGTATVCFTDANGKQCIAVYQLNWDDEVGYTSYRLYGTRDIVSTGSKLASKLSAIGKKIAGFLTGNKSSEASGITLPKLFGSKS